MMAMQANMPGMRQNRPMQPGSVRASGIGGRSIGPQQGTRMPMTSLQNTAIRSQGSIPFKNMKGMAAGGPIPQQAVMTAGQDPLTSSMLADAAPQEQKQMLGERLFPLIHMMYPDLAGKITGMLLEIDNSELLHMLESRESLKAKVLTF